MLNRISPDEAKAIRKGRRVSGLKLTQERLGLLFGVTKRTVLRWEAGEEPIEPRTALAFRFIERASQEELDAMWEAAQAAA
ncbi:MAG TPA: hypothetical protein VIG90_06655 [Pedomonas sp.]|uniref:helix-turn-helix domain-containing protein n=1 Tax=Pedomonas sp. TaxID=2976421 RepID=UPI002F3FAFCA